MANPGPKRDPLAGGGQTLTDRVQERVNIATRALDRRSRAVSPKARPAKRTKASASGAAAPDRDVLVLREVFTDLGKRYRQYRLRTGAPISPAIRTAARAFKAEPSLRALVPVAGFLDELDLLDW